MSKAKAGLASARLGAQSLALDFCSMSSPPPEALTCAMAHKKQAVQCTNTRFNPIVPPTPAADQQCQAQKTTSYNLSGHTKGRRYQQCTATTHATDVDSNKLPNEGGEEFIKGASGDVISGVGSTEPDVTAAAVVTKESKKRRRVVSLSHRFHEMLLTFRIPGAYPDVDTVSRVIPRRGTPPRQTRRLCRR